MQQISEYPESFLKRLEVVGSTCIAPENSDKYWREHKANMTWGTQKALSESGAPRDVAILGAGKCNDIRLLEIMQRGSVENIDLYDLDSDSVKEAIEYVKAKILSFLPEAINFANFNPVLADVTFVMKKLLKRFDEIRSAFKSDMAIHGPKRQNALYSEIMDAINEALQSREVNVKTYDTVVSDCILSQIIAAVEIQINYLRKELLKPTEIDSQIWDEMDQTLQGIFIEDHIEILKKMTRAGGTIFIATDRVVLYRGKEDRQHEEKLKEIERFGCPPLQKLVRDFGEDYLVFEIGVPRFSYMEGDLLKIIGDTNPELKILGSRNWEWNRQPHQLQGMKEVFYAEKVQGVVLKKLR